MHSVIHYSIELNELFKMNIGYTWNPWLASNEYYCPLRYRIDKARQLVVESNGYNKY